MEIMGEGARRKIRRSEESFFLTRRAGVREQWR